MTTSQTATDPALAALSELHPGWRVWRSRGSAGIPGAYYATRRRELTCEEAEAEVPATLGADTVQELARKLTADAELEQRGR